MKLEDARHLAEEELRRHGLDEKGWRFEFDRARVRFGSCNYDRKVVTLSPHLTRLNGVDDVLDTIRHEIAHALAGRGTWHGERWKRAAQAVGCRPERCYGGHVKRPPRKFVGECPSCGHTVKRDRRNRLSCGKCSPEFDPAYLIQWRRNEEAS